MHNLLSFLGLAKRAGKLVCGDVAVSEAFDETHVVCVSNDLAQGSSKRAEKAASRANAPIVTLPYSKEELGRGLGRKPCGILAVTDEGFAKAIIGALVERK